MLRRLWPAAPVAEGLDGGATAADRGADFEAHHRQGALGMSDQHLAEEDLPKTRDSEAMSHALDARAGRVHLFDAGTKNAPVWLDLFQSLAVLKRILRYFTDFSIAIILFLGLSESWEAFEKLGVQLDFNRTSGDAKILELAADHGNETLRFVREMFGIEAGNNTISSHDVQEIESLDRGGHQRVVAVIVSLVAAGNVRVALTEGNKLAKLEVLDARTAMPTDDGKRTGRLYVDGLAERTREAATEGMSTGMVVKRSEGLGAHVVTFYRLTWQATDDAQ